MDGFGSPKQNLYDVNKPIKSCGMPEVAILSPLASQLRNLHFVVSSKEVVFLSSLTNLNRIPKTLDEN